MAMSEGVRRSSFVFGLIGAAITSLFAAVSVDLVFVPVWATIGFVVPWGIVRVIGWIIQGFLIDSRNSVSPENVLGQSPPTPRPTTSDPPRWSESPGCLERRLKLRYQNPLFPPEKRNVARQELESARARDSQDLKELLVAVRSLCDMTSVKGLTTSEGKRVASFDDWNQSREKVNDLLLRAAQLGGVAEETCSSLLRKLYDAMVTDVRASVREYPSPNKENCLRALQEADQAHQIFMEAIEGPAAQYARDDSAIDDVEFVPYLLTEDPDTIRRYLALVNDKELTSKIKERAKEVIRQAEKEGSDVSWAREKLAVIE